MPTGKLFVFEGADEVGKTTLASMLVQTLAAKRVPCSMFGFPGNELGTLGRHIYELHHDPTRFNVNGIDPTSLQTLHVAAHIDTLVKQVLPALRKNRVVILDRFWWSTWIYGKATGASDATLRAIIRVEKLHWERIRPERVFLVTRRLPLEPQKDIAFWNRVNVLYRKLAGGQRRSTSVTVIANESTPEVALSEVRRHIKIAV